MKRRMFALGLPVVGVMALAGCKSKSGDELLGYWVERHSNGRTRAMLRIRREGDVITMTVAEFGFFSREGQPPREESYPLVYSRDLGQHGVQSDFGFVPVIRVGEAVSFNNGTFQPATAEQYAEWMATLLPVRRF